MSERLHPPPMPEGEYFDSGRFTGLSNLLGVIAVGSLVLCVVGAIVNLQRNFPWTGATPAISTASAVAASLGPIAYALVIAAVLVLGRAYLSSQSELIIEQINEFSARLINALIDSPDVRLGHR